MRMFVKSPTVVEDIVALNKSAFSGVERAPDGIVRDLVQSAAIFVSYSHVAYEGKTELYGAAIVTEKFNEPYIWSIAVAQKWRGMGIGGTLLDEIACYARELPATGTTLCVNANNAEAQRLYLKAGYRVMKFLPRYYGANGDGLIMRRPL